MTKRRVVATFSNSFDGKGKESVINAAVFADALRKAVLLMVPVQVEKARSEGEEIDEAAAMEIANNFEIRVMNIDV